MVSFEYNLLLFGKDEKGKMKKTPSQLVDRPID